MTREDQVRADWLLMSGLDAATVARMMRANAMELELLKMLEREEGCLMTECMGAECCRDGRVRALLGIQAGDDFSEILDRIDAMEAAR